MSGNFAWSSFYNDIYRKAPQSPNHFNIYQTAGIDTIIAVEPDARWARCCMDAQIIIEPHNFVYYGSDGLRVDTGQWNYTDIQKEINITIKTTAKKSGIIANDDSTTTIKGATVTIMPSTLLSNDINTKDTKNKLTITSVTGSIGGSVSMTLGKTSKITFTPHSGFTGKASFKYIVTNGLTADEGMVSVNVVQPDGVKSVKSIVGKNKLTLSNNVYIEGCSFARVAANMTLITQVINYFWDKCEGDPPSVTTYIEIPSIPIDYNQHKHYNYTKWLKEQSAVCKTKC